MLADRVVINSSPLITLFKSEQEDLLPLLFSDIVVPKAVFDEVTQIETDRAAQCIAKTDWINVKDVAANPSVLAWDLGSGETSVIGYAIEQRTYLAMIDDKAARRCAKAFGIQTIGTGRTLILAKQRGLIPSVSERLDRLQKAGLWLSPQVIHLLKEQANE